MSFAAAHYQVRIGYACQHKGCQNADFTYTANPRADTAEMALKLFRQGWKRYGTGSAWFCPRHTLDYVDLVLYLFQSNQPFREIPKD